jgi:hypothetical protein
LFNSSLFRNRSGSINQGLWKEFIRIASDRQSLIFLGASFLVSVPVFIEAPLVRALPNLCLALTIPLLCLGLILYSMEQDRKVWGDLVIGFSWSWLAGSIYWGWFRTEPFWHLPIEAIALPVVLYGLYKNWSPIGGLFYLGSLLGTAVTDSYFYLTDLIPYWRQLMSSPPESAGSILHNALISLENLWAISWAVVLVNILIAIGLGAYSKQQSHWSAFSGAVLSTIMVDALFWVAAYMI